MPAVYVRFRNGAGTAMASPRTRTLYPWGAVAPRERLRVVCSRLARALDDAKSPGFGQVSARVSAVVQATRPLVDALRYLSQNGLRPGSGAEPLPARELLEAVDLADRAVSDLAAASALELSEHYRSFSEAVDALLALGEQCRHRGVAAAAIERARDGWTVFER